MIDVGSGVFQTQYRLNGEAGWRSDSRPFPLNQTGNQTVVYQSTDRALNTEIAHTLTLPLIWPHLRWTVDSHLHDKLYVNNYVKTQGYD